MRVEYLECRRSLFDASKVFPTFEVLLTKFGLKRVSAWLNLNHVFVIAPLGGIY